MNKYYIVFSFFYFILSVGSMTSYGSPKDAVINDRAFFSRILSYLKYREIVSLKSVKKCKSSQLHAASLACSENDQELVIRNQDNLDETFASILKNECFQYIKQLNLSGSFFDIKWLERMPGNIEALYLAYVEIRSGENLLPFHQWICVVLKKFPNLKVLDLSGNAIRESIQEFSHFSESTCLMHLETLILRDNGINHDPMEYLVHFPSIKKLDLGDNEIYDLGGWSLRDVTHSDISGAHFSKVLEFIMDSRPDFSISYFPNLETIILEDNRIQKSSMSFLALLPELKFLNLNNNHQIKDSGLHNFFQFITSHGGSKIEKLELRGIGLTDMSVINLELLPALRYLDLGRNQFHQRGIDRFLILYGEIFLKIEKAISHQDYDASSPATEAGELYSMGPRMMGVLLEEEDYFSIDEES